MSVNADRTVEAVEKAVECFKDGFQFSDVLTAVRTVMEIAETMTTMVGLEKKKFVVDVVAKAYKEVNPNIPWVPEPVETWVEDYILKNLVPYAVDMISDATKGKIKVNNG